MSCVLPPVGYMRLTFFLVGFFSEWQEFTAVWNYHYFFFGGGEHLKSWRVSDDEYNAETIRYDLGVWLLAVFF